MNASSGKPRPLGSFMVTDKVITHQNVQQPLNCMRCSTFGYVSKSYHKHLIIMGPYLTLPLLGMKQKVEGEVCAAWAH